MGNGFKTAWVFGSALVLCSACGADTGADASGGLPPYQGPLPSAPAAPASADPAPAAPDPDAPAAPANPGDVPNGEVPAAGENTPLTPPAEPSEETTSPAPPPAEENPPANENPPGEDTQPVRPVDDTDPPPAPRTQVFLLFGQSNMWGVPNPQAEDLVINPRVEVLTAATCGRHGTDQWMPAQPPLHGCVGQPGNGTSGPGVGPGDYFGKTLAAAFPDDTILLVPNAIPGVSIDVFQPGQQAYNSTVARARIAQERGEIRGIIFHQGETDCGQDSWPDRVKNVVDRLRSDLGIGDVPFLAGEMLYANQGGTCGNQMNPVIALLPGRITNAFIVSAEGLGLSPDQYNVHFNLAAQRTFGQRYGEVMLDALGL